MEPTKGPWHYQEDSDAYTHIIRGSKGEFIGSAPQGTNGECEANARIMAASPELLEALKKIMEMRDRCYIPNDGDWWDKMANSAIAKAEAKS